MTLHICRCHHLDPPDDRERLADEELEAAEGWADHPDWRVREWAAQRARDGGVDPRKRLPGAQSRRAERYRALRARLADDPHPAVREATTHDWQGRQQRIQSAIDLYTSGVPLPAEEVCNWSYEERHAIAGLTDVPIPAALLDDPDCDVRSAAAWHTQTAVLDEAQLAELRADVCPRVRDVVLHRFGPDPTFPLEQMPTRELVILARITSDAAMLTTLASQADVEVRLEVARNPHCPSQLLPALARHPIVFGAALANPAWPPGVRPPDPFAPEGDEDR